MPVNLGENVIMRDEAELSYVVRSHSIFGMEIPRSKSNLIDVAHLYD